MEHLDRMQPRLRWSGPNGSSQRLPLGNAEVVIGRHDECELVINDGSISRYQAKILNSQGEYLLLDMASINGTLVNGRRIKACILRDGDCIHFPKSPDRIYFEQGRLTEGDKKDADPESRMLLERPPRGDLAAER